ncbi:MAG: MlaA family lipoprotein [Victivallaceae bacterium]|nr:MlaA family lipoprotein [Victivallaceae bacterium]
MKLLKTAGLILLAASVYGDPEVPVMRFVPGIMEMPGPESHCYDYAVSGYSFPVPEGDYCFSENGKLYFLFRERPEPVNLFHEIGGSDPLEGFNRVSFSVCDFLLRWAVRPLGMVYSTLVPRPAIKAVNNVTNHVAFPKRFLSCLLQGKFTDGGLSLTRFAVNSTAGVGGLWDASDYLFGIKERDEDFGQVFASWGIGPGCYIFLPGEGPCNLRDAVGKIFDYAVDIKSYVSGVQAASGFLRLVDQYEDYDAITRTSGDPYRLIKNFWSLQRLNKAEDRQLQLKVAEKRQLPVPSGDSGVKPDCIKMNAYGSQGPAIDSLKVMFFHVQKEKQSLWGYLSFFNTDFVNQAVVRSVKLQKNKDEMEYRFWKQEDKPDAPLILLIPGLGAHYRDGQVTAMAEMLYNKGFAVAVISSTFNWEFMETAASTDAPGFLPRDAADTRRAWQKIIPQLEKKDGIKPQRIIMLGYSMGAIQSLYIAKLEEQRNTLGVDRYLAINPPVDLMYGVSQLDNYYDSHRKWTREQLIEHGAAAFGKMMQIIQIPYQYHAVRQGKPNPDEWTHHGLTITQDEARFIIGYSFKMTLQDAVISMYRRGRLTGLKTQYRWYNKTDIYNEILKMSFRDYLKKILMYYYKGHFDDHVSEPEFMEKFAEVSSLQSFKNHLADNPDIRIVHTRDDFLLNEEDRGWLKDIFKEKIAFFEHGSHLGYLHFRKVHDQVITFLQPGTVITPEQQNYYREHYASLAAPYSVPSVPPLNSEFHNPR